jgi:hypothetical protein
MAESLKSDITTQKDWWKLIKYFISPTEKQSIPPLKNPINDKANVCAVFKKGDPSVPNNHRPISLLCCVEKVFERIIFKYLFNFLQDNNSFLPYSQASDQVTQR